MAERVARAADRTCQRTPNPLRRGTRPAALEPGSRSLRVRSMVPTQGPMLHRPIGARLLFAWLWLGLSALGGCADDAARPTRQCAPPGMQRACECSDATAGKQLCLADGTLTACDCEAVRTVPCSAPGVAFECACGERVGHEVCRLDGRYSPCDCSADEGAAERDAAAPPTGGENPAPSPCPAPFTCTEQMGVRACTGSDAVPPLCSTAADCAAEGLPEASCVDPMIGGVLVCYQPC